MLVHARSTLSSLITWANDSIPMRKNGVTGVIFLSLARVTFIRRLNYAVVYAVCGFGFP